jgi:hypothetical protein
LRHELLGEQRVGDCWLPLHELHFQAERKRSSG